MAKKPTKKAPVKPVGMPRTEAERQARHKAMFGGKAPPRGTGMGRSAKGYK